MLDINHLSPSLVTQGRLEGLPDMVNAGDAEGIFRLFNAALTEGISANAKAFNDENSIRDFIYILLPRDGIIKSRGNPNAKGFSDLEIRTNEVKLVIEFKRIRDDYPLRLIRAAMVISPKDRNLADFRVLEEDTDSTGT